MGWVIYEKTTIFLNNKNYNKSSKVKELILKIDGNVVPIDLYDETRIDVKGNMSIHLRSNNSEDIKCLVILVSDLGKKSKPIIIFSGLGVYLIKTLKSITFEIIFLKGKFCKYL